MGGLQTLHLGHPLDLEAHFLCGVWPVTPPFISIALQCHIQHSLAACPGPRTRRLNAFDNQGLCVPFYNAMLI